MKTVLIADDEDDIRSIFRMRLEQLPCRIVEARTGTEALEIARQEHPDLILLDWFMPRISGLEILKALRADPALASLPVILISGEDQVAAQSAGLGVHAYFVKPFSTQDVLKAIKEVLLDGKDHWTDSSTPR
ncbi:MAG: response regulator [Nitrospirales bacterium]